jgi:hypothetical protein
MKLAMSSGDRVVIAGSATVAVVFAGDAAMQVGLACLCRVAVNIIGIGSVGNEDSEDGNMAVFCMARLAPRGSVATSMLGL